MASQPHFVLFPFMAQGHIIPLVDFARLLARRGALVSIVTTPHNAARFDSIVSRDTASHGLSIRFLLLDFPWQKAGLPEGCETADSLPTSELTWKFTAATSLLRDPAEKLLQELSPLPSCIVSDVTFGCTIHIARKLNIPRISFQGFNCFFNVVMTNFSVFKPHEHVQSENEYFVVPGLPHQIEITKAQAPQPIPENLQHYRDEIMDAESASYGMVVNTFEELETEYVKELRKTRRKVWCVGPVSLCNRDDLDKVDRGRKSAIDEQQCSKWLDSRETKSVVYVCLGSLCNLITSQLIELALGLELSKRPFIWAIRRGEKFEELEQWLAENRFEERNKERGLLIKGWAPQVLILSHPAVGGFLTHCGGNGIQEGICSGVPMITWPLFADQFINEKLVVEVLRIGVKIGVEKPMNWGEEEKTEVMVKREDVKEAIEGLMEGGEAEERRRRVEELAVMAKAAMAEGGSSYLSLTMLIDDIMEHVAAAAAAAAAALKSNK